MQRLASTTDSDDKTVKYAYDILNFNFGQRNKGEGVVGDTGSIGLEAMAGYFPREGFKIKRFPSALAGGGIQSK